MSSSASPPHSGALFLGPPLTGARVVVPLPPLLAGPGAHIEFGLQRRWPAARLVVRVPSGSVVVRADPWDDPEAPLGPHDDWASI